MAPRSEESPPSPEIRPCLAELLRTCFYPPSLALRIDKIQIEDRDSLQNGGPSGEDDAVDEDRGHTRKRAYRLFVSDGVLVLQALLEKRLLRSIGLEQCKAGNIIVLKKYGIRRARRVNGEGHVVFLTVEQCDFSAGYSDEVQRTATKRSESGPESEPAGEKGDGEAAPIKRVKFDHHSPAEEMATSRAPGSGSAADSDSDDEFETSAFDRRMLDSRREALQQQNEKSSLNNSKSRPPLTINEPTSHKSEPNGKPSHQEPPHTTATTTITTTNPPSQPPIHTLQSLLAPPGLPKSYHCTLFAIITWTSPNLIRPKRTQPTKPAPLPTSSSFPAKRHIKIHDLSLPRINNTTTTKTNRHTDSGITVAVYCNAIDFKPRVGTVALFHDLVAQRATTTSASSTAVSTSASDVILNAYPRLMNQWGVDGVLGRWFEDDRDVLGRLGFDVGGLEAWWREKGGLK